MATIAERLAVSRLKAILAAKLPGVVIRELKRAPGNGHIGGVLIWPQFRGRPQIDRQDELWQALRKELHPDELLQVGLLLTVTPEEFEAITED